MKLAKATMLDILRRAGFTSAAAELEKVLPDPVDIDRDEPLIASYGITREGLEDAMGGSP